MTIIIVGAKGTGKTTQTKEIIRAANLPALIYDVNNEYGNNPLPDIDTFLIQAAKMKNATIVFEEATIFFSAKGRSEKLIEILVRSRHNRTLTVLNFHSLRSVPTYILELTNYLILKATNDNPGAVETKYKDFPEVISLFNEVNEASEKDIYYTGNLRLL